MYRDERDPDLYLGAAAGSIAGGGIGMLAGANRGEQTGHMYLRNLLGTQHSTETLSSKDLAKAREYLKAVKGPNIERNYIQGFSRRGKNKGLMIGALLGAGIGAAINRHSPELTPPAPQVHDVWIDPNKAKVGEYIDKWAISDEAFYRAGWKRLVSILNKYPDKAKLDEIDLISQPRFQSYLNSTTQRTFHTANQSLKGLIPPKSKITRGMLEKKMRDIEAMPQNIGNTVEDAKMTLNDLILQHTPLKTLNKKAEIQGRPGAQQHLLPLGQMKRDKLLKSMSYNRNT